jgi:hypothetical protein
MNELLLLLLPGASRTVVCVLDAGDSRWLFRTNSGALPSSPDSVVAKNGVGDQQNESHKTNDLQQATNNV